MSKAIELPSPVSQDALVDAGMRGLAVACADDVVYDALRPRSVWRVVMKSSARLAAAIALLVLPQACSGSAASEPGADAGGAGGGTPDSAVDGTGGEDDAGATDADGGATDAEAGIDAGHDASADADASTLREECRASAYGNAAYGGDAPGCGECLEDHCATECLACYDSADCVAWLECAQQCSDVACQDACAATYPLGEPLGLAWMYTCNGNWCGCWYPSSSGICDTGLTVIDKPCDTCLGDNCCQIIKDCLADSACDDCLMNGTSDGCGGNAAYTVMETCWATCDQACNGGDGPCGLTSSDTTCEACIEANCCDQGTACFDSPGCIDVLTCMQGCTAGDTVCEDNCAAADPAGAAILNDFFGCLTQSCDTECGG